MKKKKVGRKFHKERDQRKALLKSLCVNFFNKEKMKTTEAKAKEVRSHLEKMITKAKKGDLTNRRELLKILPRNLVKKLIENIAPKYKDRNGGYTRIIKLGPRKSDGAKMAIIELV